MSKSTRQLIDAVKAVQQEVPRLSAPPAEGVHPKTQQVVAHSLVRGTRGYIEKVVYQINGSYENGWFDACAVMIRRLIETLIIEAYEYHQITDRIKNNNGDFLYLNDLIHKTLAETTWNLSRNTKNALPKLKDIGDQSAHSRRFIAHSHDIDQILSPLRAVVQELIAIAHLKK